VIEIETLYNAAADMGNYHPWLCWSNHAMVPYL
jgi:hypothetical protein